MALYRANFISRKGSLQVVNTLHLRTANNDWVTGPFTASEPHPTDVANELDARLEGAYRDLLTSSYTFDRIDVQTIANPNDPSQVPTAGSHVVAAGGTRGTADEDLPPFLCGVLRMRTGLTGRSFRGRMFLPPIEGKATLNADLIDAGSAYATNVTVFANLLKGAISGGGGWATLWASTWTAKLGVYSPTRHRAGHAPWFTPLTDVTFDRTVHALRSRTK